MNTKALYNTCVALAQKATEGMKRILSGKLIPPINQSGLFNKLGLKTTQSGSVITIETEFPPEAKWVEWGRRPGKRPPASALVEWCRRHSMVGAEFALAKRIGERGIAPRPFTTPLQRMIHLLGPAVKEVETKEITNELLNNIDTNKEINIPL